MNDRVKVIIEQLREREQHVSLVDDEGGFLGIAKTLEHKAADMLVEMRERIEKLESKLGALLADNICVLCGRSEPCMTDADLGPDDPGVPCTFDPTPRQLWEENVRLRKDAERYRWALPILTDGPEADQRALRLAAALMTGLDGDAAIDAAREPRK
jgi:hypothetical protein